MTGRHIVVAALFSLMLVGSGLARLRPALATEPGGAAAEMQMNMGGAPDEGVPSYHAYNLETPFPTTLDPKQFPDAIIRNVYALAAKIKPVLFQQPCYCYCDRHAGHKSLLDCFATTHGSECDVCLKEAVLAYQLTKKGKTPAQIRAAVIHGDWKSVDMNPYAAAAPVR
jgi:Protein of unknown function with PCYCGC motif